MLRTYELSTRTEKYFTSENKVVCVQGSNQIPILKFFENHLAIYQQSCLQTSQFITMNHPLHVICEFQDWFYYCLVYDPQQKALLADKGETGVGTQYQPVVPAKLEDSMQYY